MYPGAQAPVNVALDSQQHVEHVFREELRKQSTVGVPEDEEHILRWCDTCTLAREPFIPDIMLLARGLKLGSQREWPTCLQLCGIVPQRVVEASGMGQNSRWRKRRNELNRVPREWFLLPPKGLEPKLQE